MTTVTLDRSPRFTLKQVLGFDALSCLAFGVLLMVGANPLGGPLGLPQALLFYAGVLLMPCAALMWLAARTLAQPLVWSVILGNVAWVIASVFIAFSFEATTLGLMFIAAQAIFVDVLALLEWRALRR
jgi:hypothetical protein